MANKSSVLIIGAGAAGLHAGYLLAQRGVDFLILEAADRVGGRLGKLEGFADYPLDLGAEWLHGKQSWMGKLVKQTQTAITRDKSKVRYWFQGQLVKKLPVDVWETFEEENLPDISYQAYGEQLGMYPDYEHLIEGVAGDFGAAADQLSAYGRIWEERNWSSGNKDYKFARTYYDLVYEQWAMPILDHIRLNTVVSKINYQGPDVSVEDTKGIVYQVDTVILAVPISILQAGEIAFIPPLPPAQTAAFQQIGMGPGMKVFLKFSTSFYQPVTFGGAVCAAYADERMGKAGKDHVLLAFVMGKQAAALSALETDQAMVDTLLAELDHMYDGQASAAFLDAHIIDWGANPYIRGAYSFSTVGIGDARSRAAQPIDKRIFMAGEAMNLMGHHQTVHGAAETGKSAVEAVLKSLHLNT